METIITARTYYIYDNPSQLMAIKSPEELESFFKTNSDFQRWQFVLSELNIKLTETAGYFATRRMRELSGLGVNDE